MELMSQKLLTKLATEQMSMVGRGLIAPAVSPAGRLCLSDTVPRALQKCLPVG